MRSSISLPQAGVPARCAAAPAPRPTRSARRLRRAARTQASPYSAVRNPVLAHRRRRPRCAPPARSRPWPRSARARASTRTRLAEPRLRQQQEVVVARAARRPPARSRVPSASAAAPRHARPSRDVVREHPLEEVLRVGARDPNVVAWPRRHSARHRCHAHSVGIVFRSKAEQKVADAGYDPARLPSGPVPDREVAGPARRLDPDDRPRHVGLQGLRRGREAGHAQLGRAAGAAEHRDHERHPLRDALEPIRHDASGASPGASSRSSRSPKPSARFVVAHAEQGYTANVPLEVLEDEQALHRLRGRRRAARARARLAAAAGDPEPVLLEERQVAARDRALCDQDQPGFWERYGYHNDADYWKEERYEF